jgi:hypothetical protein
MSLHAFQLMARVVDKLYADKATAIVVAPEWQRMKWYGRLLDIAARTYRIPRRRVQLYCDMNGRTFRQRSWHTVAFLVDPTLPRECPPVKTPMLLWPVIRWIEEVLVTPSQKKRLCQEYHHLLMGAVTEGDGTPTTSSSMLISPSSETETNTIEPRESGDNTTDETTLCVTVGHQHAPQTSGVSRGGH